MSIVQGESVSARTLAWLGLGASVIALAFTVRPLQVSAWVFWIVVSAGAAAAATGGVTVLRTLHHREAHRAGSVPPRCRLVASECRRVQLVLTSFIGQQALERPRAGRRAGGRVRLGRWREETAGRYRRELRSWALEVFNEAVACEGISDSARALVEAPSAEQLVTVRDLFGEAAELLERLASG